MNNPEDQDPAWQLLAHARKTEIAGSFTQDVMREIRKLDGAPARRSICWFSLRSTAALAAAAVVVLAAVMLLRPSEPAAEVAGATTAPPATYAEEISIQDFADELAELAYLSDLLEVPDTSLLADEELAALLF